MNDATKSRIIEMQKRIEDINRDLSGPPIWGKGDEDLLLEKAKWNYEVMRIFAEYDQWVMKERRW